MHFTFPILNIPMRIMKRTEQGAGWRRGAAGFTSVPWERRGLRGPAPGWCRRWDPPRSPVRVGRPRCSRSCCSPLLGGWTRRGCRQSPAGRWEGAPLSGWFGPAGSLRVSWVWGAGRSELAGTGAAGPGGGVSAADEAWARPGQLSSPGVAFSSASCAEPNAFTTRAIFAVQKFLCNNKSKGNSCVTAVATSWWWGNEVLLGDFSVVLWELRTDLFDS